MADEIFAKRLQTIMNEDFAVYGKQLTPVLQAEFPNTSAAPSEETPNTAQTTVTNGETTEINAPRSDIQAQQGSCQLNPETMGEISSLLVTIGYILSKESIVPDKFNTGAVVEFLSKHFPANANVPNDIATPPTETALEPGLPVSSEQQPVQGIPQEMLSQKSAMYESRQLLEKRWKK